MLIVEYFPLPEEKKKKKTFSVWAVEIILEMCSIPTVTIFQFQVTVSRM